MSQAVLTKQLDIQIALTPVDIAHAFWSLDSVGQARFFNYLSSVDRLPMQLAHIADSPELSSGGRHVMLLIGDYAQVRE